MKEISFGNECEYRKKQIYRFEKKTETRKKIRDGAWKNKQVFVDIISFLHSFSFTRILNRKARMYTGSLRCMYTTLAKSIFDIGMATLLTFWNCVIIKLSLFMV